jgi:hypothetical protein
VIQQAGGCTVNLSSPGQTFDSRGGAGTIDVTAGAGCSWTVSSNADWITIVSAPTGSGSATIEFQVAANGGDARSGTITVGTQTFTVTQTGP